MFHLSLSCGIEKATEKLDALAKVGVDATIPISVPVLIGLARSAKNVAICRSCVSKDLRLGHAPGPDHDIRTVGGGLPGLGKRH